MTEFECTPQAARRLAELVTAHGLTELTVEVDGAQITVRALPEVAPVSVPDAHFVSLPVAPPPAPSPVPTAAQTVPGAPRAGRSSSAVALESPMVGVFYRSPSPEDAPFVLVGDTVKVGQPIGLIEAMKVVSEVPAEVAGRVVELPVESGKLVQQGQPLIYVEPM